MIIASFSTTNIQTRINTLDKVKIEPINSQLLYTNFSRILVITFEGGHLYHPHRLETGFKKKRNPKWKEDVCLSSKSGTWSASGGLKGAIVEEGRVEIWGNRGEPERLETLASARSRELSHRSVSILPSGRVFVERERGWRGRGEEKIERKKERRPRFNAKASCRKDLSAAYFPGHVRTFSISVERFFVPVPPSPPSSTLGKWPTREEAGEGQILLKG